MMTLRDIITGIMLLPQGTRLGRYRLLRRLAQGGMGEVYRLGLSLTSSSSVAIKILPEEMSADAVRKQRFEREADHFPA